MNKIFIIGILVCVLISSFFIYSDIQKEKIIPINCNEMGVIFLLPSERGQASTIANHINGVVVIPETNELIARSDILLCPNFKASDYIDTGGLI